MAGTGYERPMYARELAEAFGFHSESEIRAMMRRRVDPLPSVASGRKRPHRRAYPTVYMRMLDFERGLVTHAEVEQEARRVLEGALQ